MKFGKEIQRRQLDFPEYAASFVDYKALKKLIKHLGAIDERSNRTASTVALQANKDQFFFKVERALDKVNSVYLQKEAELKIRLTYLLNRRRTLQPPITGIGPAFSAQSIALEDGLQQFVRDLDKLQRFVEINQTAFSKILKKWDKTSKTQQRAFFLSRAVDIQPCFNREVIADLSEHASNCLQELAEWSTQGPSDPMESESSDTPAFASSYHFSRSEDDTIESGILHGVGSGDAAVLQDWIGKINALPDGRRRATRAFLATAEDAPEPALGILRDAGLLDLSLTDELTGQNVLHKAAITGRSSLLQLGLAAGPSVLNVMTADIYGRTPVHYAAIHGHSEQLEALVQSARGSLDMLDHDSFSPLLYAIVNKREDCLRKLLSLGAHVDSLRSFDQVPLNVACQYGLVKIVEVLLQFHPKLVPDGQVLYAQHLAARSGSVELIRVLRAYGADFSLPDGLTGWTPLMHAASEGKDEVVKVLLDECGVDCEARDEKGNSALHYAAWEGHSECTRLLEGRVGRTAVKRVPSQGLSRQAIDFQSPRRTEAEQDSRALPALQPLSLGSSAWPEPAHDQMRVVGAGPAFIRQAGPPPPSIQPLAMRRVAPGMISHPDPTSGIPDIPEISLPPPIMPLRRYGHNFLDRRTFVVLSLGNLGYDSVQLYQPSRHPSARLTVSARSADLVPRSLSLPIPDDSRVLSFQIDNLSTFALDFDVYPSCGPKLIARAVAGSAVFTTGSASVGIGHVELLDQRLRPVGRVSFRFQLIHPFKGVPLQLTHFATYWKQTADDIQVPLSSLSSLLGRTSVVAENRSARSSSQGGTMSNVSSPRLGPPPPRVTGSSLSGEYVRLEVRLTADGIPIVHPSPYVSFYGRRFLVSALTFAEFAGLWQDQYPAPVPAEVITRMEDVTNVAQTEHICPSTGVTGDPSLNQRTRPGCHFASRKAALIRLCRSTDPLVLRLGLMEAHASLGEVLNALPLEISVECHIVLDDGRYREAVRPKWTRGHSSSMVKPTTTTTTPTLLPRSSDRQNYSRIQGIHDTAVVNSLSSDVVLEQSSAELAAIAAPRLLVTDINSFADSVLAVVFDHARDVRRQLKIMRDRLDAANAVAAAEGRQKPTGGQDDADADDGIAATGYPKWRLPRSRTATPGRGMVFSSFDSDICLAMNWKQPNYPVLLCNSFSPSSSSSLNAIISDDDPMENSSNVSAPLNQSQNQPTPLIPISPPSSCWSGSLGEAVMLARTNNFMGIICSAKLLKLASSLVGSIKGAGLVLIADAGKLVDASGTDSRGVGMSATTSTHEHQQEQQDSSSLDESPPIYERMRLLRLQQEKLLEPLVMPRGGRGGRAGRGHPHPYGGNYDDDYDYDYDSDGHTGVGMQIDGSLLVNGILKFGEGVLHV